MRYRLLTSDGLIGYFTCAANVISPLLKENELKPLLTVFLIALNLAASSSGVAAASRCADADAICRDFEKYLEAEQPEKVLARYKPSGNYSDAALSLIGSACLAMASRDNITPEEEEGYYRKALSVKHYIAYMGLYFSTVQKDEEKALNYLREYVKTKPADTVPYVILGEAELQRNRYALADTYLREAKRVAHAYSSRVDWLLFQANYLQKNYAIAQEMFESAITRGTFEKEISALSDDPRFADISARPEFRKHKELLRMVKTSQ